MVLAAALAPVPAAAWDRIEKEIAAEVARIRRRPTGAAAELAVLEIFARWDRAGPGPVTRALEAASSGPGLDGAARERVRSCLEEGLLRTGDLEALAASRKARGFIEQWSVAGPFPDDGGAGFALSCPGPDAGAGVWREVPGEAVAFGRVEASALAAHPENSCLCLAGSVEAAGAGPAVLRLGAEGAFTAWWNGAEVLADPDHHGALPDRRSAGIGLRPGTNRLAVRLCAGEAGGMALLARITPRTGKAGPARDTIDELLARARSREATPAERHAAARYLLLSGAVDPASHEARDLARTACLGRPAADRCLTWAALAAGRDERRLAIGAALRADPVSIPALLELARLELEGPEPRRALAPVRRAARLAPADPETVVLDAGITAAMGLPLAADARARPAVDAAPDSPAILAAAREIARAAGLPARALELTSRLAAVRFDSPQDHLELARAALARGDTAELDRRLGILLRPGGGPPSALALAAELLEGRGERTGAERLLERIAGIAPDDAEALRRLARFLLRHGEPDRGLEVLGRALELRPQDDRSADYLAFVTGGESFAEPWIVAPQDFRPTPAADDEERDATCLVDNTVVWVHPSGLASRFRQQVWRVGGPDAARELRRRSIQFAPDSQRLRLIQARVLRPDGGEQRYTGRVTVAVAEPWYRLYYDLQAEIVELPALRPGDVVELSYRLDDIAHRNVYSDYFGDLTLVQDDRPKALWRYVVLAPPGLRLEFRTPARLGSPAGSTAAAGGRRAWVFELRDVPRCRLEPGLPGATAACDYFHISTYRSWDGLGRWYQGLIRDQMVADDRIREQVRGLIAGRRSDREKVAAIHGWVVTATRYVGLEFGIHGYRPYRAPLVAARGFGDCKDKASLLVAALREAGVEAEFALVRTRFSGDVDPHPPSLAVFDHAIAYVPGLDLWLDGTAELHGSGDLPFGDQDALALRLSAGGPVLTRTPVLPPEADRTAARVRATVEPDGGARLETEVEISGARAAGYRSRFAAEESRRARFEDLLVERLPGASLGRIEFGALDDLERPVRYRYEATWPDFARRDGERLRLPVDPGLGLVAKHGAVPVRGQALEVGPRRVDRRSTGCALPDGWAVEHVPADVDIASEFGNLKLTFKLNGNHIDIIRSFVLSKHLISAAETAGFLEFCHRVDEALAGEIVIRRQP